MPSSSVCSSAEYVWLPSRDPSAAVVPSPPVVPVPVLPPPPPPAPAAPFVELPLAARFSAAPAPFASSRADAKIAYPMSMLLPDRDGM